MKRLALVLAALALCAAPAAAQKGQGVLSAGPKKTVVQIVLCMVRPAGTTKESGLDVEFMNLNNQGYLHLNDFKGDGAYVEHPTAANPVFLFGTTMGSVGGGTLSVPGLKAGSSITVKTAPKTGGHTGLAKWAGGSFSWVCP